MDTHLVYVTTKDSEEAAKIGTELVDQRFAACVNIIDNIKSIYRWQGNVCDDSETILICKTTSDRVDQVIDRIKSLHSYSCPCVVVLPIIDGNPEFLRWIAEETSNLENKP